MEYYSRSRMTRALNQPMFLISAEYTPIDNWYFTVQGYSGSDYNVVLTPNEMSCTCPDFRQRNRLCKHLYFVIAKVADDKESLKELDELNNIFEINSKLTDLLKKRLYKNGTEQKDEAKQIDEAEQVERTECVICFDHIKNHQRDTSCETCKNTFHKSCIDRWLQKNSTCPLCRQKMVINNNNHVLTGNTDSLAHFDRLIINSM